MKVKVCGEKPFIPIIVTIETKEEADILWAAFNMSVCAMEENSRQYVGTLKHDLGYKMWDLFNREYNLFDRKRRQQNEL